MASDKSRIAKLNLKTSLYFAGSITFGAVAVGAGISIPVYLEIKKSLAAAIEKFSNLSQYLSQLAQKLGIPGDSEFEQELANGYVAVHSGEGTQVFKEVNGQKVLVMNTKPDGTVQTAASFEGVEALTMLTAIDSAKEAFDNEAEAMKSILAEYSDAIDDSSYLTEAVTTGKPVAILILRDKLADFDITKLTPAEKTKAVDEANAMLNSGIATRNNLNPDHVEETDIQEAIDLLKIQRNLATLDQAKASNSITDDQKAELEKHQREQEAALAKAQKELDDIKQKQAESAAQAAQKAAETTQAKVIEKVETNPGANASFIYANTSTFQKWFALLGATFGNKKGNGLEEHAVSTVLREPIMDQLEKNGLENDKFEELKDSLLEMIGVSIPHGTEWTHFKDQASKKIMTVTPILNTFANTAEETRIIIFDIKVNNIQDSKIEDYFLLAHPSAKLAYDFETYTVIGEDMGPYKNDKQGFEEFVQTITQLSLTATSKTLQPLNGAAFGKIQDILKTLHNSPSDLTKIKLSNDKTIRTKLEDLIKNYGNKPETSGIYQEIATKLFDSHFNVGGKEIKFDSKYLGDFITMIIAKDGYQPSAGAKPEEIYKEYENQKLLRYVLNNFDKLGDYQITNGVADVKEIFENNWASFDAIGISNEIRTSETKLMFSKDVEKLIPSNNKVELDDLKDVIGVFQKEIVSLLRNNPTDLKPYIKGMKLVKSLQLDSATIDQLRPLLTEDKYLNSWDELVKLSNDTNWKLDDGKQNNGTPTEAIAKYLTQETKTFVDQFNKNVDIVAIKESIRYTFKGVSVSNPTTKERIDAAKDVAKDLDNIPNLDASLKASIQSSVEQVITSQDTQTLAKDEFDTIMKYTQTVFKLFPTPTDATKQLQKVLEPAQLVENNHAIVKNIATLNKWVDEIAVKNPNTTITLPMIKDHAWKDGVVSTKYVNGNPSVDVVAAQNGGNLLLAGAQLTSNNKIMTIGSYMWGLWELEHTIGSSETKITPVVQNGSNAPLNQPPGGWASAPSYNGNDMYAIPLVNTSNKTINAIYKYNANGKGTQIPINVTTNSKETRTAIVLDVGAKKIAYGFSNDGYFDEYDITDITKPATQTRVAYSSTPEIASWMPTWTATAFKINSENYVVVPLEERNAGKFGLSFWHAEPTGHLKFVNFEKFDDPTQIAIYQSVHKKDPQDPNKTIDINSGVWTNAIVSGEADGDKASLFMLGGNGKLWNFKFESFASQQGQFKIDNVNSGVIIDAASILPQMKPDPNDQTKTVYINNPWRGMTYNKVSHEINIYGITGAIYIPNQNQKIADIYEKLLT